MRSTVTTFVVITFTLLGLFYAYLGRRLFAFGWPSSRPLAWALLAVPFALVLAMPLLFYLRSRDPQHAAPEALFYVVYIAMSFLSALFTVTVLRDLGLLLPGSDVLRSAGAVKLLLVTALVLTLWGYGSAYRSPIVKRLEIPMAGLPSAFDGYRVVLLSDLHIGPTINRSFVERIVKIANTLDADLAVMPGDVADSPPEHLRDETAALAELKTKDGRFYTTGNHEYYWNGPGWISEMARLGWTPLVNKNQVVRRGDAALVVAGVTDPTAFRMTPSDAPNFRRALSGAPENAAVLWLAHQPAAAEEAAPLSRGLMVAGHTHGGQFFPWNLAIHLFHKRPRGLYTLGPKGRLALYVSPGTGHWGPPSRLGVPAEITLLTLRTPPSAKNP